MARKNKRRWGSVETPPDGDATAKAPAESASPETKSPEAKRKKAKKEQQPKEAAKKEAVAASPTADAATNSPGEGENSKRSKKKRRKSKISKEAPAEPQSDEVAPKEAPKATITDAKAQALALQDKIRARLAALKSKNIVVGSGKKAASDAAPPPAADSSAIQPKKKARRFELDMSVTAPTFERVAPAANQPPKKKVNPYLAHQEVDEVPGDDKKGAESGAGKKPSATTEASIKKEQDGADEEILDERLVRSEKLRRRNKTINFVEPGTFVEIAERKRHKAANAVESGFASGRKVGTYYTSSNMADIYGSSTAGLESVAPTTAPPPPEASEKTTLPNVLEWWDVELLPTKLKKKVAAFEGKAISKQAQSQMTQLVKDSTNVVDDSMASKAAELQDLCFAQAALSYCKTAALIQHIVPVKPSYARDGPEAQPTLYLTKKERKRQRKLRREEKQRDAQDMQAAGLTAAPEPRLTLKNFMRVLGDQAYLDPSQMEQKVREQIEVRQRAHLQRNEANKLTKEQRSQKRAQKLQEDTEGQVHVAVFYVKDMSHPYHRAKVELNAQQHNITGGVLECENPKLSCVIVEGGPKALKKYQRLMLVRMKWQGLEEDEDSDEEEEEPEHDEEGNAIVRHKFSKDNKCELVWTGLAVKRFFKGFVFQSCESTEQARKVLTAKGVGYIWDQVLNRASGRGDTLQLKLADSDNEDEDDDAVAMEE